MGLTESSFDRPEPLANDWNLFTRMVGPTRIHSNRMVRKASAVGNLRKIRRKYYSLLD